MPISKLQAIVVALSLLAVAAGVAGLVVVGPMPPPKAGKITRRMTEGDRERRAERRGGVIPRPTGAPPMAEGGKDSKAGRSEPKPDGKTASQAKEKTGEKVDKETIAAEKLKQAKAYDAQKNTAKAKEYCQEIVNKYSDTKALEEAILLLNKLN